MMEFTLITGRTIAQGIAREGKKTTADFVKAAAICELDPQDLAKLGVAEGTPVRVSSDYGFVVVYVAASTQAPHLGIAFMPLGPWANQVINPDTDATGTPSYKCVKCKVEPATGEKVYDAVDLISKALKGM